MKKLSPQERQIALEAITPPWQRQKQTDTDPFVKEKQADD